LLEVIGILVDLENLEETHAIAGTSLLSLLGSWVDLQSIPPADTALWSWAAGE
jgi:hypothetical protein